MKCIGGLTLKGNKMDRTFDVTTFVLWNKMNTLNGCCVVKSNSFELNKKDGNAAHVADFGGCTSTF